MSAWAVGAMTTSVHRARRGRADAGEAAEVPEAPSPVSVDTLVVWIPGEVIAAYAAIVLALQPEKTGDAEPPMEITSAGWIVGAMIFAAILTALGGWARARNLSGKESRELAVRAVLAAIAFLIWSAVVPGSAWYDIDDFAENQTVVALVAGLIAAVFSLFAEGITRRLAPD
jgi:hypothetical protein